MNTNGEPGYRFYYAGDLFKCVNGDPEFQKDWIPGVYTSAIYTRIADETETGTIDNPISAARGMEYIYGKYYLDPEDSNIYLCQREGSAEGERVQLAYLPHELVGHYFTKVPH